MSSIEKPSQIPPAVQKALKAREACATTFWKYYRNELPVSAVTPLWKPLSAAIKKLNSAELAQYEDCVASSI